MLIAACASWFVIRECICYMFRRLLLISTGLFLFVLLFMVADQFIPFSETLGLPHVSWLQNMVSGVKHVFAPVIGWFTSPANNTLLETADGNELDSEDSFENSSYSDDHNNDGSEDLLESENRGFKFAVKQKKLEAGSDSFDDGKIRYKSDETGSDSFELPDTLKQHLTDLRMKCLEIAEYFKPLADETDKIYKGLKTSKLAGSAAGILGGALRECSYPFAVPFGASRSFNNSGEKTEGSGRETVTALTIAVAVKSSAIGKRADAAVKELNEIREKLVKDCNNLSKQMVSPEYIEAHCLCWVEFWSKLFFGTTDVKWQLTLTVVNSVMNGKRIADLSSDIARSGGIALYRVIGPASCLQNDGGVFGALLMPLDIYTLIVSGIESHKARKRKDKKKTKHTVFVKIRETAELLTKACPTDEDIEKFISEFGQK